MRDNHRSAWDTQYFASDPRNTAEMRYRAPVLEKVTSYQENMHRTTIVPWEAVKESGKGPGHGHTSRDPAWSDNCTEPCSTASRESEEETEAPHIQRTECAGQGQVGRGQCDK